MNVEVMNIENVKESELPEIIHTQFKELASLKESVDLAMEKAESAKDSADRAKENSAGMFKKKAAIESLQEATVDLAEAQVNAAEAQKISFAYQEKLGKITKYLFGLGVSNIAASRTVMRELQMRLNHASKEELDDLARQEIQNVVEQLKAQEDMSNKHKKLTDNVKSHDGLINEQAMKDAEHDRLIAEQDKKDAEHDRLIAEQDAKDKELAKLIADQEIRDNELAKLIAEQEKKDVELAKLIAEQEKKDNELDKLIKKHDEQIDKLKEEIKSTRSEVEVKSGKVLTHIAAAIAVVALVLSGVQFFL